jgi:hypothetical protein
VFPSIVSPTAEMVTVELVAAGLGLALAWPVPRLLALGLAGPAALAGEAAPGSVPVALAG